MYCKADDGIAEEEPKVNNCPLLSIIPQSGGAGGDSWSSELSSEELTDTEGIRIGIENFRDSVR